MSSKPEEKKADKDSQVDGLEMIDIENIGKKAKRKKTTFDYVRYAIMFVSAVVFIVAAYQLYSIYSEYSKGEKTYDDVADNFIKTEEPSGDAVVADGVVETGFVRANVDFVSMQQQNPDVKAWIQFEALEQISYPILQHPSDNDYYLTRMWNNEKNTAGSIFLDVTNHPDFQDYNTFVYGHNMKNLSMFGRLKEYKDPAFYAGKEYFWIYTPDTNYQYLIFSIHEVKTDSSYFKTFETMGDEFTQYVAKSKADSRYDTGVEVTGEDHIVTLSTCTASGKKWRLLVQGKLVGVERKTADAGENAVPEEGAAEQPPAEEVPVPEVQP